MKVRDERFPDGTSVPIHVDQAGGFYAEFAEQRYDAQTLLELVNKLGKAVKKFQNQRAVDVSVVDLVYTPGRRHYSSGEFDQGRGVIHARLRAKHERQYGTWLLESVDGKRFQVSGSDSGVICRRLTEEEVAEYTRLAEEADRAQQVLLAFKTRVGIDPDQALEESRRPASVAEEA